MLGDAAQQQQQLVSEVRSWQDALSRERESKADLQQRLAKEVRIKNKSYYLSPITYHLLRESKADLQQRLAKEVRISHY